MSADAPVTAVPGPDPAGFASSTPPLLALEQASVVHRDHGRTVRALEPLDLTVREGRSLGVVGESGAGKTTLLSLLLGLRRPTTGVVRHRGQDLARAGRAGLRALRRDVQVVFQDPFTSLDPRMRIGAGVGEALPGLPRADRAHRVREVLNRVGIGPDALTRYPADFSGGQRQRIAIARALAARPRVLVADEPVSALDVLIRQQVVSLLARLRSREGLTLVVVSHDIALVAELCDELLVLDSGHLVEHGATADVLAHPGQEYTRLLLDAVPRMPDTARTAPSHERARR